MAPDGEVVVTLGLHIEDLSLVVPEDDFPAWARGHEAERPNLELIEGHVRIAGAAGEGLLCDGMASLVRKLCFETVVAITAQEEVVFEFEDYPTAARFRRRGGTIEVASTVFDPIEFPARPLLAALVDAGERFIALSAAAWGEAAEEMLPELRQAAEPARAAVAGFS